MGRVVRVLDLFSGIGGFSLGLKRAGGFKTVGYCEIDPYCQQVLQARMRDGSLDTAPICTDITKLDGKPWRGGVDLICGGFPCQDISLAGDGIGIEGERSGLWREMHRIICEVRPGYVFVENVAALLARGMGRVLGDLAEVGYDAEWSIVSACSVDAPHSRERVFLLAYPGGKPEPLGILGRWGQGGTTWGQDEEEWCKDGLLLEVGSKAYRGIRKDAKWLPEPELPRMAHGLPVELDRIHSLGNAVVPQVIELIGRRIIEAVGEKRDG